MVGTLVLLKTYDVPNSFQVKYDRLKSCCCFLTPGNVVRGSQSYATEILTAASGHDLHDVHRMSTNLLSWYLLCSQRESRNLGNVILNNFISTQDEIDGWIYVPSTVFQSFRDDGRVNMKGSVQ